MDQAAAAAAALSPGRRRQESSPFSFSWTFSYSRTFSCSFSAAFAENRTANPAFAAFAAPCKSRVFPSRRGPYGPVSAGFSTPGPGVWGADGWGKRRGLLSRGQLLPVSPCKTTKPRMNTGFFQHPCGVVSVAPAGVEPAMGESKSPALPLGDGALHPAQWLTLAGRKAFLPGQKELSFQLRQRILLPR